MHSFACIQMHECKDMNGYSCFPMQASAFMPSHSCNAGHQSPAGDLATRRTHTPICEQPILILIFSFEFQFEKPNLNFDFDFEKRRADPVSRASPFSSYRRVAIAVTQHYQSFDVAMQSFSLQACTIFTLISSGQPISRTSRQS
jgi:hypothetical protein